MDRKERACLANQMFVVSGVLSTILSCGLGLGYVAVFLHQNVLDNTRNNITVNDDSLRIIETAGETAFVPSIVIIPFLMQKKGRRFSMLATTLPLLFSWFTFFTANHFTSLILFNVLHNIAIGGVVTVSSVMISEFCSPKYRGTFLMLETAMISLGVLLSHLSGIFDCWRIISTVGVITTTYSMIVTYYSPESPYWLISKGHIVKCTESFHWLRGYNDDAFKELEALLKKQKMKMQLEALRPIRNMESKEKVANYLKSLLKADFLKPLSIMILLFSFVGFGSENVVSNYTLRDVFKLTNGKYVGTIIVDILTLLCSLTACVLIQIVRRKALFLFTGSFSVIFLSVTSLLLFLQSTELLSTDYTWLFLSMVTGFVMFMSLGTTALPFSLLGEIFPMSYKGIGSSLTCAYLWAFSNSVLRLVPSLSESIGLHGMLMVILISMVLILIVLNNIMPETNTKTLLEIEQLMNSEKKNDIDYESVEQDDSDNFDRLKLFIEV